MSWTYKVKKVEDRYHAELFNGSLLLYGLGDTEEESVEALLNTIETTLNNYIERIKNIQEGLKQIEND